MLTKRTIVLTIAGLLFMGGSALADGTADTGSHTGHGSGHGEVSPAPTAAATPAAHMMGNDGASHDMGHEMDNSHGSHSQDAPAASSAPDAGHSTAGSHSHGNEAEFEETSANVPVLGSFAALNGAFLLAGAWNKFGRRPKREEGQQHE